MPAGWLLSCTGWPSRGVDVDDVISVDIVLWRVFENVQAGLFEGPRTDLAKLDLKICRRGNRERGGDPGVPRPRATDGVGWGVANPDNQQLQPCITTAYTPKRTHQDR